MESKPVSKEEGTAKITAADSLASFMVPLETYLSEALRGEFDFLATGVLVFRGDRLLIVQRAATDSFPCCWESPGGAVDPEDESVLHAAARELMEETGLQATRFVRQVGDMFEFKSSRGRRIAKVVFEVEELKDDKVGSDGYGRVVLDPNEHQNHMWITEEEVRNDRAGEVKLQFTTPANKALILEGFSNRKAQKSDGSGT